MLIFPNLSFKHNRKDRPRYSSSHLAGEISLSHREMYYQLQEISHFYLVNSIEEYTSSHKPPQILEHSLRVLTSCK